MECPECSVSLLYLFCKALSDATTALKEEVASLWFFSAISYLGLWLSGMSKVMGCIF